VQPFDTIAMVDWSGGADRGPTPKKDAIWIAVWRGGEVRSTYMRNRALAETALQTLIETERTEGRRLLIGLDFPFGYPAGFASALTGSADPLVLWDWIAANLTVEGRFHLAGHMNRSLPGEGPFWGNWLKADVAGLTRKKSAFRSFPGLPES
jgi:molybdopterin molybdotransferase